MSRKVKTRKINRKNVRVNKSISRVIDPTYQDYLDTVKYLKSKHSPGSWELFLALDNARVIYLRSTPIGKELRLSRRNREIALMSGSPWHQPSNWAD